VLANGTLSISDVDDADEGIYRCVGLGAASSSSSQTEEQVFATRLRLACQSCSLSLCMSVCLCVCQCLYWINGINGLMLSTACMSSSASQTYSQTSRPLTMLLHIANNLATYLCNLFTLPAGLSQLSENYVKQFDVLKRVLALRFLSQCVGLCSTPTSTVYRLYIDARPEHNSPGRLIIECTVVTLC